MQLREEPMKAGDLLGMPIVDLNLGEQVDSVRDVIFDCRASAVLGLEVQQGSWPRKKTWVIPFSVVYSVGEDAVMVAGSRDPGTPAEQAGLKEAMEGGAGVIGLALTAPDGTDLGRIQDVAFDIYTGRVAGYQVSGGPQEFVRVSGGVEVDKKLARIAGSPRRKPRATPQPTGAQPAKQQPSFQAPTSAAPPAKKAAQSPLAQFRPVEKPDHAPRERIKLAAPAPPPTPQVTPPAQPANPQPGPAAEAASAEQEQAAPQQQVRARLQSVVQRDREQLGVAVRSTSSKPSAPAPSAGQPKEVGAAMKARPALSPEPLRPGADAGEGAVKRAKHWLEGSLGAVVEKLETAEREMAATSQQGAGASKGSTSKQAIAAPAKVQLSQAAQPAETDKVARVSPPDPSALLDQALGQPIAHDIKASDGQLILAAGERVTRQAVAQARAAGQLRELLAAVQRTNKKDQP